MKNSNFNVRVLVLSIVAVVTMVFTSPVHANGGGDTVELKYIGTMKNQPLFQLNFNSTQDTEFIIVVRDEFNNILHRESFKGGTGNRKFLLNTDEIGDDAIRFEITGKTLDKTIVFEVNNEMKMVKDVVVSKR